MKPLGSVPVKGLVGPIELFELTGAGAVRSRLHALRPAASPASSAATPNWTSSVRPLRAPEPVTARSSRSLVSPAWASPACPGS